MSLWRIPPRATRLPFFVLPARAMGTWTPPSPKVVKEQGGFLAYTRNVSRDKKYDLYKLPYNMGNTPLTFLTRRLGHAYETWIFVFLHGFIISMTAYIAYISFLKKEVWLDRSHEYGPNDWSRCRDDYYKRPTTIFDPFGEGHRRLHEMEVLEDEMLEAARKRGTR